MVSMVPMLKYDVPSCSHWKFESMVPVGRGRSLLPMRWCCMGDETTSSLAALQKKTWLDSNWRSVVVPYISKKCLCLLFCYKWCINLVVYIMFMFNDLFCHRWGTKQHFIRKSEAFQNPFWDHAMMVIGLWESYGIIPTGAEKNQVVNKLYPDFW